MMFRVWLCLSINLSVDDGKPKMDLIRMHLMLEGQIKKDCLVRILDEVTDIYSKWPIQIPS
mgnify:CR=1 FL=1